MKNTPTANPDARAVARIDDSFPQDLAATALATAGIGACLVAVDGKIRLANATLSTLTGRTLEHLHGAPLADIFASGAGAGARPVPRPTTGSLRERRRSTLLRAGKSPLEVVVNVDDVEHAGERFQLVSFRDISARQLAEDSVRELDQRIRLLIESAQDAVVTIDGHSSIIDWNTAAARMFGWSREEALGKTLTDLIVPHQHRASHHHSMTHFDPAGDHKILNRRVETTGLRRDGSIFDIELSVWPVETGASYTFSSFIRDISDRKKAEATLRESEEKYRAVVENANEGIIVSQDGYIRYGNPRSMVLTGRTPETTYSTPFIEMIHPGDRERVYSNYQRRLRGEAAENFYNFRVLLADGGVRWLQISAVAIMWNGKPATLNFLADVTEQLELQENLKQSLTEREAILETSAAGIVFIQNSTIRWLNPAFEQAMLGYTKGHLINRPGESLFADFKEWRRFVDTVVERLQTERTYEGEWQVKRHDGSFVWCNVSGRALNYEDLPAGTIWIIVDITERKRAEEETRRALQRERELSELKTRFVAMTSHEFRTPIATILSSVELLEDFGAGMTPHEQAELMKLIKVALARVTGMIDQVLLIGRGESDRLEFHPAPIDVIRLCHAIVDEIPAARGRTKVEHDLPHTWQVRALDENLFRHIIGNLVGNAAKYSPPDTTISLFVREGTDRITIEVSDTGLGIPAADQARLFESFYRATNVGNVQGTGLGLTIVKQCVDLHGGTIAFRSVVGQHTTFTVTLPAPL
ncbi:MAG: PAS domain S-box protein [Betaproteobacteria bacterium]